MKTLPLLRPAEQDQRQGSERWGSKQVRINILQTLKQIFQFYWNSYQYNAFILYQKELQWKEQVLAARTGPVVGGNSQSYKRTKIEALIEQRRQRLQQRIHSYLSSLEATVSIIHTVIGIDYLLQGEKNLHYPSHHHHQANVNHVSSAFLAVADELFPLPYLRYVLRMSLDVLSLSYVTPVGLTAGSGSGSGSSSTSGSTSTAASASTSSSSTSSSSAISSVAAVAEYRSIMEQMEDYLYDEVEGVHNATQQAQFGSHSPNPWHTPSGKHQNTTTGVLINNITDIATRLSTLRIQIICMILEIVLMIPVHFAVTDKDKDEDKDKDKDKDNDKGAQHDWKQSRSIQLFQQFQSFLFTMSNHVIQEHNQWMHQSHGMGSSTKQTSSTSSSSMFLWRIPLILHAEYSPFLLLQKNTEGHGPISLSSSQSQSQSQSQIPVAITGSNTTAATGAMTTSTTTATTWQMIGKEYNRGDNTFKIDLDRL
jgi:hypothetical protein